MEVVGTEVMAGKNPDGEVKGRLVPGDAEDAQRVQGFWGERTQSPFWPALVMLWGFATAIRSQQGWWRVLGWGTNTIINWGWADGRLTPLLPRPFHLEKQPSCGWDGASS